MSLIATYLAAKAKQIKCEQHWQGEAQAMVRPHQIRLKVAEQLNAIDAQLDADPKLKKRFDAIKLTMPQD